MYIVYIYIYLSYNSRKYNLTGTARERSILLVVHTSKKIYTGYWIHDIPTKLSYKKFRRGPDFSYFENIYTRDNRGSHSFDRVYRHFSLFWRTLLRVLTTITPLCRLSCAPSTTTFAIFNFNFNKLPSTSSISFFPGSSSSRCASTCTVLVYWRFTSETVIRSRLISQ